MVLNTLKEGNQICGLEAFFNVSVPLLCNSFIYHSMSCFLIFLFDIDGNK